MDVVRIRFISDTEGNQKNDITTILNEDEEAIYYLDRYNRYTYLMKCNEGFEFIYA